MSRPTIETMPGEHSFTSRLRSATVAARVGVWLGIAFALAFVTGLLSHYAQNPTQPIPYPTSPSWGYRLTQALHIVAGTAAIPLLLVKLWSIYPKLFAPPPKPQVRELLVTALERGSIAVLVASSLLEVGIGVMNVAQWYVWSFDFRRTHYALAFIVIAALLVHIAVKLPITREVLGRGIEHTGRDRENAVAAGALGRRGLVRTAWLSAAVAVVAGSSAVGTLRGAGRLAVLSARGPAAGIPINRTAKEVMVVGSATSAGYRCHVVNGSTTISLSRADLEAMPQVTHTLPIACVEGWSASGTWTGVPLRALLDAVQAPRGSDITVTSLQNATVPSAESTMVMQANFVDDERTLLALSLDGQPLALDHGYPARIIAPDRPGALQTKWVTRLEVM